MISDVRVWTGFIWLRMETIGVLLKHVNEPSFDKIQGIPSMAEQLLACQEGLCSIKLVMFIFFTLSPLVPFVPVF
jgi:hypothetical protein